MTPSSAADVPGSLDEPPRTVSDADAVAIGWTVLALGALLVVPVLLETTTPVFHLLWLVAPRSI